MPGYSSFQFRMGAGFFGDVNRTHPADVEPALNDVTNPVPFYGSAVLINTSGNSVRGILSSDTGVTTIDGVATRPYPIQQPNASNFGAVTFGGVTTPPAGEIDIIKRGYVMVPVVGTPTKGGAVFLWIAASSGAHLQGGFEASSGGGNTVSLTNCRFNGPPDSNGVGEMTIDVNY